MIINIQYVKMPFSEAMTEKITGRLEKLGERYEWITQAKVFFKLENDPAGKGRICEIELSMPGPKIFASSRDFDFELAAKETIREIEKQLKKRKAVILAH